MFAGMNEENEHDDAVAYMSQFDHIDMGIEFPPYEDPPPPYTPPKPPTIPMGDAPPPYEAAPGMGNNNEGEGGGGGGGFNGPLLGNGFRPVQGAADPLTPRCELQSHQRQAAPCHIQLTNDSLILGFDNSMPYDHDEAMFVDIVDNGRCPVVGNTTEARGDEPGQASGAAQPENYGLSVAVATVASEQSSNSPSHVIVRLHNNSPQSQVVRKPTDPLSLATSPCASIDLAGIKPSYRAQFIKRSDSMEIKQCSNSPRNSYYLDPREHTGVSARAEPGLAGVHDPTPQVSIDPGARAYSNSSFDPSHWNKTSKSFKVTEEKDQCIQSPSSLNATEVGSGHAYDAAMPVEHSITISEGAQTDPMTAQHLGLNADLVTSAAENCVSRHCSECEPSKPQTLPLHPQASSQPQSRASVGPETPSTGSSTPQSPMSPMFPLLMARSGSITSQQSQFSVCSETGERKRPKMDLPVTISNDAHYPLYPLSCKYGAPVLPSAAIAQSRPSVSMATSQSSNLSSATGGTSSPTGTAPVSSGSSSSRSTLDRESQPPRISYIDQNFNDVDETTPKTAIETEEKDVDKQKKSSKIKCSDSGVSRSGNRDIPASEDAGHNTVRKLKQKKRRSRGSMPSPPDGVIVNGEGGQDRNESPERYKRGTKSRDSPGTTFKQYGFIDDPDVLASRESCPDGGVSPKISSRRDSSKDRKRDNTKDRKRDRSKEKRDRSKERRRDNSKERSKSRESSGERVRRDGSRERKRERSSSRDRNKRGNSRDRGKRDSFKDRDKTARDTPDGNHRNNDVWFKKRSNHDQDVTDENLRNGDVITTKESRPLERDIVQGSASLERKRKHRSTGDRYIPDPEVVSAILANGHLNGFENVNYVNSAHPRNNKMSSHGSKSKSSMARDNRNNVPVISHRYNLPDR